MANKSNLLVIALIVSVIANIALLAAPSKRPGVNNMPQPAIWSINKGQLEGIMRALPDARRKAIRTELEPEIVKLRTITDGLFKTRNELMPLLGQPQLDQEAVNKQLTAIREEQNAASEQAQKVILAVLSKLTAEERVAALTPHKPPPPAPAPSVNRQAPQPQGKPGPQGQGQKR